MQQQVIAGVDEAGRGPLVGAVVAAAVILPAEYDIPNLRDSKKLSEKQREQCFTLIAEQSVAMAVGHASVEEIDRLNILWASLLAMQRAVEALAVQPQHVLVDGNRCPELSCSAEAIIKGDSKVPAISAAGIVAKVTRDREMYELEEQYPGYGFAKHKGYGTKQHLEALRQLGATPAHRRSFAPVRACVAETV